MKTSNTRILLASRPHGLPVKDNFHMQSAAIPAPGPGQALIKNMLVSLDPTIRGWMDAEGSYMKPIQLGSVVRSVVLGQVEMSNDPCLSAGQIVTYVGGWEQYGVTSAAGIFTRVPEPQQFPPSNYLSVLGVSGLTAYIGLAEVGRPREGETVLVSGAAGAVGSLVCQFAKQAGCRTVGVAGTDDKCNWLRDSIGCDAAVNYRTTTSMNAALLESCPKGIDVYFDNVGGPLLQDVLARINIGARIVMCGAISTYNDTQPPPLSK